MAELPKVYSSVVHMLLDAAEQSPDHEALVQGRERLNYSEYLRCVIGFAGELKELGATGERVALIMGNSTDICIAMFAIHMARAQAVPLNPVYTENESYTMLEDAEPVIIIYDWCNKEKVEKLARDLRIANLICIGGRYGRRLTIWRNQSELTPPQELSQPEDLATLQFTGGTTGRAKGANLTHAAITTNISQCFSLLPLRLDTERMLCVMPLFHCYAVAICLHNMVNCRGTLVILPRYHPEDVLKVFVKEKITLFGGSPTLFSGLMNHEEFANTDFSNLRFSYSGSAPLPEELLRRWEQTTNTPVVEGYGQSESGPVISFNPLAGPRKPVSVGVAIPQTEIEIVDLESGTRTLPVGKKGEIRIRGPQIMSGYRNRPQETAQALRDGWLYTGDIGELDNEGYLYIRGRKKEMIIVSGYNVYPREVEEILHLHPAIKEAAVVGKADEYRGELPVAFVVCQEGSTLPKQELIDYCSENLAPYKIPAEIHYLSDLPKTSVGKIDKIKLTERAGSAVTNL
ncbi:MAG: AMP-binding protein [Gammaproteobacteria bacterium]